MPFLDLTGSLDVASAGAEMHALMSRLRPVRSSITGDGIRESFRVLSESLPLTVHRVASGTAAFDWTVPPEWNIRDAYIRGPRGERVVDLADSPLHVVGYSVPVRARMTLAELRPHLYSLPDHPDWIPYRASYYRESWGFCLRHRTLASLPDGEYEVVIDSTLAPGHLEYAECQITGSFADEVLVSTHACHPAMCNDNLSGVAVAWALARALSGKPLRFTYRFLFLPTIIGSVVWLSRNEKTARRVRHGLVLACIGDAGPFVYKRSRRGDALIDRAAAHVLSDVRAGGSVEEFVPYGYDERNYCSPGFDLPVGALSRTPHGRFPQYHTSADDLDFVRPESLSESLAACLSVVEVLENERRFLNLNPKCEPRLGTRGLYDTTGGLARDRRDELALFWVLNYSDGRHSLLAIAERARLPFRTVALAAQRLAAAGLLGPAAEGAGAAQPEGKAS
jgi:aminopeptidase-like protein